MDWWQVVAAIFATVFLLFSVGGISLLIVRLVQSSRIEKQAVNNGQAVAESMREIDHTLHEICERLSAAGQASRDNQEDMRRMIQAVSQMVLDVERRLYGEIKENRDWVAMQFGKPGTNVNFNGHTGAAQIGDGNDQR